MSHQLVLELPDEVYQPLAQTARTTGQTVEVVAQEALAAAVTVQPGSYLDRWIGSWSSGVPDAGVRHHEYLGQALADDLNEPRRE
jgi:hypothetical protein